VNQNQTILLMDEDAETLEQLQTALLRERYHVLAAVDGDAALRLATTANPNLIVSDILLAGLDGYEVWKRLRANKSTAHIPILVTSALTIPRSNKPWRPTPDTEWQLLTYDAFLPKPIDLPRFVRVVEKILYPGKAADIVGGPSVLLVTEDDVIKSQLVALLRRHDFGVKVAPSFAEALRAVRAIAPAALILDYRSPTTTIKKQIIQFRKLVPTLVIILIVDPEKEFDSDLQDYYDGLMNLPLHPLHTITHLNGVLELHNMRRRTQALSTGLITTNRNLHDIEQMLNAQNQELAYTNARLRELDSLKEMFSSMVVHDLKSPLASILGALNFLQSDISPEDTTHQHLLDGSIAAGHQMLRLIETLLERQKLEEGKLKPDAEPVSYARVIDSCIQQITSLLTLHRLNLVRLIDDNLPLVYADLGISQRVLENLLDNAIKFSPKNSTITVGAKPYNDQYIIVSVADNGPGIPIEQQQRIFDRYTQLETTSSSGRSGFGLGLTFCHLAVQGMDGAIWVESDGLTGTTFLFTLPTYKEEKEPAP
jgi:signal transduction histidine kinase